MVPNVKDLVLFALLGLPAGAFIAGLSLSAVLSYRGAGVVNLASGAIAMLGAFVFYDLKTAGKLFLLGAQVDVGGHPWSTGPAIVVALAECCVVGMLFDGIVLRRLRNSAPLAKLIATLGLLLTLQAVVLLHFGVDALQAPAVLSASPVTVLGLAIPLDGFTFSGIVIAITIALSAIYRYSRFGLATRAASENEGMAMRNGLSPDRLSMANTVLASLLAGGLGILFAPEAQLDSTTLALTIIPALAAALLARFTSFGLAALFGFAMGVVQALLIWLQSKPWFPTAGGIPLTGVSDLVYFLVIAVVLFARGQVLPQRGTIIEKRLPAAPAARQIRVPALCLTSVVVVCLVMFPYNFREALIYTLIGTIICLSLVVITGFLGQVSLLQLALAGATAWVLTKLSAGSGIGFPFAPMIGVAVSVVVGLLTALPTLRVRGVSLAIITMAAAVAMSNFWLANVTFGFNPLNGAVSPPKLLGLSLGPNASFGLGPGGRPSPVFGFLCLAAAVCGGLGVAALRRAELGQRMLAIRSNERAAAAAGINIRETKLVAYGIGSMLAGVGGALYAYSFQAASSDSFSITVALGFVAYAYLGGITTVTGAIVGGLLCTAALSQRTLETLTGISPDLELALAGLVLIVTVVQNPDGIVGGTRRMFARRHLIVATAAGAVSGRSRSSSAP